MTEREFLLALYRMIEVNQKTGVLISNFIKEHENDYKFNLPPLGRSDFVKDEYSEPRDKNGMTEQDRRLENFYCGGI